MIPKQIKKPKVTQDSIPKVQQEEKPIKDTTTLSHDVLRKMSFDRFNNFNNRFLRIACSENYIPQLKEIGGVPTSMKRHVDGKVNGLWKFLSSEIPSKLLKVSNKKRKSNSSTKITAYRKANKIEDLSDRLEVFGIPIEANLSQVADSFPSSIKIELREDLKTKYKTATVFFENLWDAVEVFKTSADVQIQREPVSVVFAGHNVEKTHQKLKKIKKVLKMKGKKSQKKKKVQKPSKFVVDIQRGNPGLL